MTTEQRYFEIVVGTMGQHLTLRHDRRRGFSIGSIRLGYGSSRVQDNEIVWLSAAKAADLRDALTTLLSADDSGDGEDVET